MLGETIHDQAITVVVLFPNGDTFMTSTAICANVASIKLAIENGTGARVSMLWIMDDTRDSEDLALKDHHTVTELLQYTCSSTELHLAVLVPPFGWTRFSEGAVSISDDSLVATKVVTNNTYHLVTTGEELSTGKHYWELEILSNVGSPYYGDISKPGSVLQALAKPGNALKAMRGFYIGVCRPNLNLKGYYGDIECEDVWFLSCTRQTLSGNIDEDSADYQHRDITKGPLAYGDRVGVSLDFGPPASPRHKDGGSLTFFLNGVQMEGGSFPPGSVGGPVGLAIHLAFEGQGCRLVPDAAEPEDA
jgi:hypothetical protein